MLKQRTGKSTIHINGDIMNAELLFQTINSVNQVTYLRTVSNWGYKFCSEEGGKRAHSYTRG